MSDFSFRERSGGEVAISRAGRVVTVLRGRAAADFLAKAAGASADELQLAMARVTGNYRRGNERAASAHARNRR